MEVTGMIKLNILNMNNFLSAVNSCRDKVYMLCPDGSKVNINRQAELQNDLWNRYRQNRNYLQLTVQIPDHRDYMNLILSHVGNY